MSRKLLAFLLSELKTVRIICKHPACGVITEMPLDKLAGKLCTGQCPACQKAIASVSQDSNAFLLLAKAAQLFAARKDDVEIEFVIPDNGDEAGK